MIPSTILIIFNQLSSAAESADIQMIRVGVEVKKVDL